MILIKCYRNDSILLLNQKVNSSVVNQTQIITISWACLAEILRCCKNDQILESHYQWQENVLKQEKYKDKANRYDLKYESFWLIMFM